MPLIRSGLSKWSIKNHDADTLWQKEWASCVISAFLKFSMKRMLHQKFWQLQRQISRFDMALKGCRRCRCKSCDGWERLFAMVGVMIVNGTPFNVNAILNPATACIDEGENSFVFPKSLAAKYRKVIISLQWADTNLHSAASIMLYFCRIGLLNVHFPKQNLWFTINILKFK